MKRAISTARHKQSRITEEQQHIRAAIQRLADNAAERSNGALNIASLAAESGISRQRLYEFHPELLDEFKGSIGQRPVNPDIQALQRQIADLKERNVKLVGENDALRDQIRTLAAIITELTHDKSANNVVAIPTRSSRRR